MLQLLVVGRLRSGRLILIIIIILKLYCDASAAIFCILKVVVVGLAAGEGRRHLGGVGMELLQLLLIRKIIVLISISRRILHNLHLLLRFPLLFQFHALRWCQLCVLVGGGAGWLLLLLLLLLLLGLHEHRHVLLVDYCFTPLHFILFEEFPGFSSDKVHF